MTTKHITDAEIQQFVLHESTNVNGIINHIEDCADCKIKVEQYNFLFKGIQQQEKPEFDFDLAELVVAQLPKPKVKVAKEKSFSYFFIFISLFFIGIVFFLFGNDLINLFWKTTPILIGLILTTIVPLSIFLCVDMYKRYQTQMKALNYS